MRSGHTRSCGCKYVELRGKTHKQKRPFGESNKRSIYRGYKRNAKNRNVSFDISLKEFSELTSQKCFYCGCEPNQKYYGHKEANGYFLYNGLDRLDNTKGYTLENCVPCCGYCNWMKKDMTVEEFEGHIRRIYKHLKLG